MAFDHSTVMGCCDTIKTYLMPEVIITATRSETMAKDVGRSVSVISGAELRNTLYQSLGDLLSQQEGIYVVGARQNPGALQSIFLRGAANNQTAIMVDDIRITDPSTVNNALDASELSLAGIDRVETVRGSHSTLYGSSAIGGVINLITQKNKLPGIHVEASLGGGAFGQGTSLFSQSAFVNYSAENGFYTNLEMSNLRVRGLNATVDTISNPNVFKNLDKDGFKKLDALTKMGFKIDHWDIYASYKQTRDDADIDRGAYIDDDNATMNFKRDLLTYGATYLLNDHVTLKYVGGYSSLFRKSVDDSSVIDKIGTYDHTYSEGEWEGSTATNELQVRAGWSALKILFGLGQYYETMTSRSYYYSNSAWGVFESKYDLDSLKLKAATWNAFLHADINGSLISEQLSSLALSLGARLNHHEAFGNYLTFELNPTYRLGDEALLFASYSTGFNAPSLYQLFIPNKDFSSGITRGNPSLKPERSNSAEFGMKLELLKHTGLTVSYFRTVVTNMIDYVYLWEKSIAIDKLGTDWMRNDYRGDTYLNIGEQTTGGFEFTLHSAITDRIWCSLNLTLVSGELNYAPTEVDNAHTLGHHVQLYSNGTFLTKDTQLSGLVRRPNTVNASIGCQILETWGTRIDIRHAGSRNDIFYNMNLGPYGALGTVPVAKYTLVDLIQNFDLFKQMSVQAKIENLFDVKYSEINGYTTRGRGLYIAIRYNFSAQF